MTQVLTAASEISDRVMGFAHSIGLSAMVGGRTPKSTELQSVVRVGDCSGVLIQPDIVLTSAHCVEGPVDVTAMGRTFGVTSCAKHPGYEPGRPAHDIGFCRLATSVPASAIALDDGSLVAGGLVSMAGYGLSNAFAREVQVLRVVDSSVVRVGKDSVDVGTGDHTACRGDSGGPVLVERGGSFHVAAIIHGGSGAICASPAEAVPVNLHRAWLAEAARLPSPARAIGSREIAYGAGPTAVALVLAFLVLAARRRLERR